MQISNKTETKIERLVKDSISFEESKTAEIKAPTQYLTKSKKFLNERYFINKYDFNSDVISKETQISTSPIYKMRDNQNLFTFKNKFAQGVIKLPKTELLPEYSKFEIKRITENLFYEKIITTKDFFTKTGDGSGSRFFHSNLINKDKRFLAENSPNLKELMLNRTETKKIINAELQRYKPEELIGNMKCCIDKLINVEDEDPNNIIDTETKKALLYFHKTYSPEKKNDFLTSLLNDCYYENEKKILAILEKNMYNVATLTISSDHFIQIKGFTIDTGIKDSITPTIIDV
jgi:hypothetical protein